jgi:pimeloyl-ACP methyl ester carboxylesterase
MAEGEEAGDAGLKTYDVVTNGVSLSVTQQGEGPAVLFCHGFPDTSYTWRRLMKAIASAGYQAIAPDMRDERRSSAPADAGVEAAPPSLSERPIEMRFISGQGGYVPNEVLDFTFIAAAAPKPTSRGD